MRWLALTLVLAACAAPDTRLRVLCYNIRHGLGSDETLDLTRIARVIRAADADLVSLQEVDRGVRRSDGVDQPAELGRLTGMTALFEQNIPYQGGEYGNAVLTRLPVERSTNHALPQMRPGEQRGALEVVVRSRAGPVRFVATHFDYRPDDSERLASIRTLENIAADGDLPTIVAGDLNASHDSRVMQDLLIRWHSALPPGDHPTYPAPEPQKQIDWVLMRPSHRWRVISAVVLDEPTASDHRPVLVVIELLEDG